mmetsp:Transcript_8876/g.11564  ORF Transcript_8876/g.11564 Transcript_8876/m.11564 type:complete len:384 (+) Transcript_8876:89-1240(+)
MERSKRLAQECNQKVVESCKAVYYESWKLGKEHDNSDVGIVLSGGVDTCAVMAALKQSGENILPTIAFTVYASPNATDRKYAPYLAKQYNLKHVEIDIDASVLLEEPLELCVKELGTFDGMQLRNSAVVACALLKAKEFGVKYLYTGDASDELLGGYSFSWGSDDPEWSQKRAEMCSEWMFSAPTLGEACGIQAESPYCNEIFKNWALSSTTKDDCVGIRMIQADPTSAKESRKTGKMVLRDAFPEAFSAYRRKDPIEIGSGSTILGSAEAEYFIALYMKAKGIDEKQKALNQIKEEIRTIEETDEVEIRNAEHLFYYQTFVKIFPRETWKTPNRATESTVLPTRLRKGDANACIKCSFELYNSTCLFCRTCGAWPARKTVQA